MSKAKPKPKSNCNIGYCKHCRLYGWPKPMNAAGKRKLQEISKRGY